MIPAARAALDAIGGATLIVTKARGHEKRCARDALAAGASTIVVLGGDGTISQVACELVRLKSVVPLAIFAGGTGNDFAKSLGAPVSNFAAMARLVAAQQTRTIDAGQIDDCVFVNSAGFGFDAEVVARTRDATRFRGQIVYIKASLEQLFRYRGFVARRLPRNEFGTNDAVVRDSRWLTMVFANGGWFGGSFRIAPEASLDDGLLDAVYIRDTSPLRRLAIFARALSGQHVTAPEVQVTRAAHFVLEFPSAPLYQADGELYQATSTRVEIRSLPGALRIIA